MFNPEEIKLTPLLDTLRLEDIDDAVYFSEKYKGYISNSRLSLINPEKGGSPYKYFQGFAGNKIYSDSLVFGSALHEIVLQPESFEYISTVRRPTAKAGFIADHIYSLMKKENVEEYTDEMFTDAVVTVDYYHGIPNKKQVEELKSKVDPYIKSRLQFEKEYTGNKEPIFLDIKSGEKLEYCQKQLQDNKKIQKLLNPEGLVETPISANEKTILLDMQVEMPGVDPFVIRLKSKLDNYTIDCETNTITINDLKTTGKMVNQFDDAVEHFSYYREMGMYSWLLSLCAKKFYNMEQCSIKSNFLVVSTIPQYYTKVVPMTKKLFMKGFEEFKYLTKMVAYYTAHQEEIEEPDV